MTPPVMAPAAGVEDGSAVAFAPARARPVAQSSTSSARRVVVNAIWRSRLLVWAVGSAAALWLKLAPDLKQSLDPTSISSSFGSLGNVLAAPAVRWDSIWYLQIAHSGYTQTAGTRFFPLYPLLIRIGSLLCGSAALAGVLISVGSLFGALIIIHRLTVLELGRRAADLTVELIAFGPVAMYLSAVYSESLFLLLASGTVYSARRGRWAVAGMLGGLAALTRVTGVLLLVPLVILYLYGPRTDATPLARGRSGAGPRLWTRLAPRFRIDRRLAFAVLIPAGTGAFAVYLWALGYGPLSFLHAQTALVHHYFLLPLLTVWRGAVSGWYSLRLGLAGYDGLATHSQSVVGLFALVVVVVSLAGAFRRLPPAYGLFVLVGLLVPLSSPSVGDPFKGLARYVSVLFPLYMWLGAWASERGLRRPLLIGSSLLLMLFTVQFVTWHVVGSQFI